MKATRIAATVLLAFSLVGCSTTADKNQALEATAPPSAEGMPVEQPMEMSAVKDPVKDVLKQYLDALGGGDYTKAVTFWAGSAGKTPDSLKVPGVSQLEIVKMTVMTITPDTVEMLVTFTAKVEAGSSTTEYRNGQNVRLFTLVKGAGGFKITKDH